VREATADYLGNSAIQMNERSPTRNPGTANGLNPYSPRGGSQANSLKKQGTLKSEVGIYDADGF